MLPSLYVVTVALTFVTLIGGCDATALSPTPREVSPSNPVGLILTTLRSLMEPVSFSHLSNGERLKRGLPLKKPQLKRSGYRMRTRQSPALPTTTSSSMSSSSTDEPSSGTISSTSSSLSSSPSLPASAPPSSASASLASTSTSAAPSGTCTPVSASGVVQVTSTSDPSTSGYLGATANSFGEYPLTEDATQALALTLTACGELTSSNGLSSFPYFGAMVGFASTSNNLGSGSANYVYLGGVSETSPNSPAQDVPNGFSASTHVTVAVESGIWTVDSSGVITPHWVNTDGSMPATTLVYVSSSNAFALVGDVQSFSSNFGSAQPVTFTFVNL